MGEVNEFGTMRAVGDADAESRTADVDSKADI